MFDGVLAWGVGVAAESVGVDVYEVGGVAASELAFEFACDGEGWRDDGFADVESCAEALCEGGFSCAEWP